jgi:RNA polymerase sigma-70 factor (ECF subfamily)
MDDLEAIKKIKSGEISGLENLVNRYQHKAVQTAYLVIHDEQLAEDVVQDVFIKIYRNINQFDESRPFSPYLMRCVVNASLDACRRSSHWVQYGSGTDINEVTDLLLLASSAKDTAEKENLKVDVELALAKLPPKQRAVIVQRYYLGMGEKEMSESLCLAPGTIKWLLFKAREHLRRHFEAERNAE